MTITIPPDMEQELADRARRGQTDVESVVRQAIAWYLHTDPEIVDELEAWQEIRDEALRVVEDSSP